MSRSRLPLSPQMVTLINDGSAALSISSITATGDFQQTNTCGTSLAGGGGTCTIQVIFMPQSVGLQTDQITITDNAGVRWAQRPRRALPSRETVSFREGR